VVYGGSVNLENAAEIAALENVDGLLIGGASLDVDNFIEIIKGIEK
jgi:triosephosphate isomerase